MGCLGPILAIDTSSDQAGLAVLGTGVAIGLTWQAGRTQTISVLDQIDRTLALANHRPDGLGAIAVATGPGMFTSLRVGLSLAKGLASGLDLPIVGVSTLRISAHPWLELERDVVAVISVGRGRSVWQRFSPDGFEQGPTINGSFDELRSEIEAGLGALAVGELPDGLGQSRTPSGALDKTRLTRHRDPLVLARLGVDRLEQYGPDDLTLLQSNYAQTRSSGT